MKEQIIIACDFKSKLELESFLEPFKGQSLFLKIGMELFYKEGISLVKEMKNRGHRIFLDLKLHDIPNTVKASLNNLKDLEVDFITIHAGGGLKMMEAAADVVKGSSTKLLAVTVLTSLDEAMLQHELNVSKSIEEHVIDLAKLAQKAGIDGCICSPHEVTLVKENVGESFMCVTPGIRLAHDTMDDQKRVMTPLQAIGVGADYLVVGRSITGSASPIDTYNKLGENYVSNS